MRAQAPAGDKFYNRTHELECLTRLLSSAPNRTGITVIVGPVSCGKTALVQHYIKEVEQPQPPLYLNCRTQAVNTPDSFASALLLTTESAGEWFKTALAAVVSAVSDRLKLGDQSITVQLAPFAALFGGKGEPGSTPIASVLNIFQKALEETSKEGHPRPPIIIDEANALTSWSTAHPEELAILLRFFVAVTKEGNMTHVVLITSDYAFISWLEKGEHTVCPGPHGCCQVLHDVATAMTLCGLVCSGGQELAQCASHWGLHSGGRARFLQPADPGCSQRRRLAARLRGKSRMCALMQHARQREVRRPTLSRRGSFNAAGVRGQRAAAAARSNRAIWFRPGRGYALPHRLCGVCCALSAVHAASNGASLLHADLQDILKMFRSHVKRGLTPGREAGWTGQQYAAAVRAITAGAPNAVPASVLEEECGGGDAGWQVLQAMVRADLVAYRPYSQWARDLPVDAFRAGAGPDAKLTEVVTAPTPAHLHCMRELTLPDPALPADPVGQRLGACAMLFCHADQVLAGVLHTRVPRFLLLKLWSVSHGVDCNQFTCYIVCMNGTSCLPCYACFGFCCHLCVCVCVQLHI